jgi:hypothetical protein
MSTDNKYVFLSHSHHDYDKVCRLRNLLEAEGFKPLMFFLKAFERSEFEPLLKPILQEEIDQRQRFILCRSENSKKSDWVRFEEDYIKSKQRPYEIVDLDASEDIQIESIKNYRRRTIVFVSYPVCSWTLMPIDDLRQKLNNLGFIYTAWENLGNGPNETEKAIKKAAKEGYVLYLIDSDRIGPRQMFELQVIMEQSARVILVWIQGVESSPELTYIIEHFNILDVRTLSQDEQVRKIVENLVKYDLQFNKE